MSQHQVYEPSDALKPVKAFLIDQFAAAGAPFNTVRVALNADWEPGGGPQLVLFDDGGPMEWPIDTRVTVRATVWSTGRDLSRTIAHRAIGLLLSKPIPGVAQVLPGMNVMDARDSKTLAELATFTVRTRVRTAVVS